LNIEVSHNQSIASIQAEFSHAYPFLKIELFQKSATPAETASGQDRSSAKVSERMMIEPEMTVAELKDRFKKFFGMCLQVYRKSGNTWLETSLTERWSLREQNRQGEVLSGLHHKAE
jgi:hypothetical protein